MFDPATLTGDQRITLAAAATIAAGPNGNDAEIAAKARQILRLLRDSSPLAAALHQETKHAESVTKVKRFRGTIIWVDKETTSGRGLVFLYTGNEQALAKTDGQEMLRTGILDSDVEAKRMVIDASQRLIGHKVTVTVELQQGTSGHAFRTLVGMEDHGLDPDYQATNPMFQISPAFDNPARSGQQQPITPKLANHNRAPLRAA